MGGLSMHDNLRERSNCLALVLFFITDSQSLDETVAAGETEDCELRHQAKHGR
jgi:hypothetical protein